MKLETLTYCLSSPLTLLIMVASFHASAKSGSELAIQLGLRMEAQGYQTDVGDVQKFANANCTEAVLYFGHCYGNNPAAPYLVPMIIRGEGEFVDPFYGSFFNHDQIDATPIYRMRADEAIVYIGKTPPKAAYFGFQTYLYTRKETQTFSLKKWLLSLLDPTVAGQLYRRSPNPERIDMFASISNSINSELIKGAMGSAWERRVAFISTPDRELAASLVSTLQRIGLPRESIFIEALPGDLRYGYSEESDDFLTLIRYAVPDPNNEQASENWRNTPDVIPVRVSPVQAKESVTTFPPHVADERISNPEYKYRLAQTQLAQALKKHIGSSRITFEGTFLKASSVGVEGSKCIKQKMSCMGDTLDTDTYGISEDLILTENEAIAVIGVEHTSTENALYTSLSIYNSDVLRGVGAVSQSSHHSGFEAGSLRGSVKLYLKENSISVPRALRRHEDKFFVHFFARNCNDSLKPCTVISEDPVTGVPKDARVRFLQRNYIRPGTVRGANPNALLSPVLIQFKQ